MIRWTLAHLATAQPYTGESLSKYYVAPLKLRQCSVTHITTHFLNKIKSKCNPVQMTMNSSVTLQGLF